jgi:hypothetical protein
MAEYLVCSDINKCNFEMDFILEHLYGKLMINICGFERRLVWFIRRNSPEIRHRYKEEPRRISVSVANRAPGREDVLGNKGVAQGIIHSDTRCR